MLISRNGVYKDVFNNINVDLQPSTFVMHVLTD